MLYCYDEAGNRFNKKVYKWHEETPVPIDSENTVDNPGLWQLQSSTTYLRDFSGKEIAVYSDTTATQWNIYGLDNIGKIDTRNHKFYYLKDHLGSTRAIIDTTNTVVFSQDYDPWGYPLQNRIYDGGKTAALYKFTAKERDKESSIDGINGYDYFGARYYNSRIANWTSIDPMCGKHIQMSPYNYAIRNPLFYVDPVGMQLVFSQNNAEREVSLTALKNMLPIRLESFVNYTLNDKNEYVLDAVLLRSAGEELQSALSERILYIAESDRRTTLKPVGATTDFPWVSEATGKETTTSLLKEGLMGFHLPSGKEKTDYTNPTHHSKSGDNEVYFDYTYSSEDVAITVAHELALHVFNYLAGNPWSHWDPGVEEEKYYFESEAKTNYEERMGKK